MSTDPPNAASQPGKQLRHSYHQQSCFVPVVRKPLTTYEYLQISSKKQQTQQGNAAVSFLFSPQNISAKFSVKKNLTNNQPTYLGPSTPTPTPLPQSVSSCASPEFSSQSVPWPFRASAQTPMPASHRETNNRAATDRRPKKGPSRKTALEPVFARRGQTWVVFGITALTG